MLIWHVHRKSCLAIDDDWFYRSNIYRPYISPPEYIVSWLSLGHSFLPKALWKEKYYQQQQSWWENMSPGSHQTAFPGVTLIMRLRTSDTGLGRTRPGIAKRQKPTIRAVWGDLWYFDRKYKILEWRWRSYDFSTVISL